MAEKSMTNAKTPRQVAKANRKASGSTRKDRKAALKSVARTTAKTQIGLRLTKAAGKNTGKEDWHGDMNKAAATMKANKRFEGMASATGNAAKAATASASKAVSLGVSPKKIAKTMSRASYAVAKRVAKAEKVQGTYKANRAAEAKAKAAKKK